MSRSGVLHSSAVFTLLASLFAAYGILSLSKPSSPSLHQFLEAISILTH